MFCLPPISIAIFVIDPFSSKSVRTTFARARSSAPSIIFFDEVDAIVGKRSLEKSSGGGGSGRGGDSVQERVLSALLNEMDGIEAARGVLVVVCV